MFSLGRSHPGRLSSSLLLLTAAVAAVVLPAAATAKKPAKPKPKVVGRVYTETNDPTNNQVIIFNRLSNGRLRQIAAVSTGGRGGRQNQPACAPPGGCPLIDAQGEVVLSKDAKFLFVVNAGANTKTGDGTITSFQITPRGLRRISVVDSGGKFPNSLTVHGSLLYALNSDSENIAGFVFTPKGKLIPIKNSSQRLIGTTPVPGLPGPPRQIGFDNTGRVLMVSLLLSGPPPTGAVKNTIDTFRVNSQGQALPGTAHNSTTPLPFGFAFNNQNQAIMTQLNSAAPGGTPGSAQRYTAGAAPVGPTVTTVDNAPCWVVVTKNGRHAYIVNTGGGAPGGATVVAYRVGPAGGLTRQRATKALNEFAKTDVALSADDRFVYVVVPVFSGSAKAPGGKSRIDEYGVLPNGNLHLIGTTPALPIPGISGIAAT